LFENAYLLFSVMILLIVLATNNQMENRVSIGKSALGVLFSVVFIDNLGFAIVVPYLYFYLLNLGGSPFLYGLLLASYSLLSFIFTPFVARISDRFGRRKIILVALAVSSFSYFIFGAAQAVWVLFVGRMLSGTTAATVPVAQAYVADVTTKNDRLRYLGLLGAAAGLAFIMGPAIGGTLSGLFGYAVPSFLASALAFTNLVSAYFRLPEPSVFRDPKKTVISLDALLDVLRRRQIKLLLSMYFLFFVAFVFLQTAFSPWLQEVFGFGSFETGLVFFFGGSVNVFTQAVLLPRLNKRASRLNLTVYSIGAFTVGLLVLAVTQNIVFLFALAALIFFSFGIQYVTINTLISLSTSEEAQGGTLGVAWAVAALAQTITPVLSVSVFAFGVSAGFDGLVFAVSAVIAVATVPFVLSFRKAAESSP
jgi:DHA1 family tetracycline resistance protein-like MFS transporter